MFDSKVAIVTGAAQGIGQAYAQALAREGASVVVADINADGAAAVAKQIVADGGTAIHVPVDVSDEDSAKAMVDRAVGAFGGIDYLVNNAAIYGGMKLDLLLTVPLDYYKKFMSVNHDGVLVCTRAVYKHMAKRGGGAIVNQSSTAAWLYSNFYGLAKVGVNGLTQQLARELGGMKIEGGATAAASVSDVAEADIISITVFDDAQVSSVITADNGLATHAKPGTIVAIHSTIADTTAVDLAEKLKPQGIHIVDAPVSGGAAAAAKGELAVMVGADDEAFQRIKEPFSRWASLLIHAGEPGAGTRMKLARNMLTFVSYAAAAEAQRLAEACGLDLVALGKVVRHSDSFTGGAGAIMFRNTTAPMEPADPLRPLLEHTRGLGEKDLSLALALGEVVSVDLPLAQLALQRLAAGLGVPHPDTEPAKET